MHATLKKRVADLNLQDVVAFRGALPPNQVAACYEDCDAVVLASFAEGIPIVLMEAMAARRPVISTNLGSTAELVEHGVNGLLCAPGNAKELADALASLLRDPDRARAFGLAGAQTVSTRFRVDTSAEKLEALFTGG